MNKKWMTSMALTSMLLIPSLSTAHAEELYKAVQLEIDGQLQNFSQPPVLYHDITLVPLRAIFEKLDVEVKWDQQNQKVTAFKGTNAIELKIGDKQAFKNYQPIELLQPAMIMNNSTMVPLRFVSESLGAEVKWDQTTGKIHITSSQGTNPTDDQTKGQNEKEASELKPITYQEAIDLALKNSVGIKSKETSVERSEEVREKAADNLRYNIVNDPSVLQIADIELRSAEKSLEIAKEALAYNVRGAYNNILNAIQNKELQERLLNQAKIDKNVLLEKAKQGLVSDYDKTKAENKYLEAEKALEEAKKKLFDAIEQFNLKIGVNANQHYNYTEKPVFEKLEEINLDTHVSRLLSNNKTIWLAEQKVNLNKELLDLYVFNDPSNRDTYRAKEIDVELAEQSVSQTKKQIEELVRQYYYAIKKLEDNYEVLIVKLDEATEAQRITKVQYDLGMIPLADFLKANVAVENLNQQLLNVISEHDKYKRAYKEPWIATGA